MAELTSKYKFYCKFCRLGFNFVLKYHVHSHSSGHRSLEKIPKKEIYHGNQAEDLPLAITSEEHSNVTGIYLSSMLCFVNFNIESAVKLGCVLTFF